MNAFQRSLASLLLVTVAGASSLARAQPASATATASAAPSARKAPVANGHQAPAPLGPEGASPAAPADHMANGNGEQQADVNEPGPGLLPGSVSATVVDERGMPIAGQQVRLGILFQKIAEGESKSEKFAQSDAQGNVHFSGLTRGSDYTYRVTVQSGPANYQSGPFNLKPELGQRVVLHVYPSTSDPEKAAFGMRGYFYIETRDDVFQFEVLFRVINMGQVSWVPKDVVVPLPKGFKAFKAQEGMTDVHFEAVDGVGARLKGTFSPGQNEASFRFQMPKENDSSASFRMGLPPHVAEMRVIAEASSAMNLEVDGFQPPVATANNNGQRVLVSVKQLLHRNEQIKDFVATLSGIPTPGPGRWFALVIAGCMALLGVLSARGAFDDASGGKDVAADKRRARELLLSELVALEAARRAERIGPRSYEQSRTALIDAIARLGLPAPGPRASRREARATGTKKRPKSAVQQS